MNIIGIDNGTSGTISVLDKEGRCVLHCPTPAFIEQSYTKTEKRISRVDSNALRRLLASYMTVDSGGCFVIIERPMVNPGRFAATISAVRALEATLITLERLEIPYRYVDSKEWQSAMLPKNIWKTKLTKKGKKQLVSPGPKVLKKAACDIARRLYPQVKTKDADSLLMAVYERRVHK